MRHIIIYTLAAILALSSSARTISDFFIDAPDKVMPLLPQSTRLDMLDYFNYGSSKSSENIFGGNAKILAVSDKSLNLIVSDDVELQLILLEAKNDTVVAVITTICLPVNDSKIDFFDSDWVPVKSPVKTPAYVDWITPEGKKHLAEIRVALPFIPVKARFDENTSSLVFANQIREYLGEDFESDSDNSVDTSWFIPSFSYSVNGTKFAPIR